jgi:hypothetical protein
MSRRRQQWLCRLLPATGRFSGSQKKIAEARRFPQYMKPKSGDKALRLKSLPDSAITVLRLGSGAACLLGVQPAPSVAVGSVRLVPDPCALRGYCRLRHAVSM